MLDVKFLVKAPFQVGRELLRPVLDNVGRSTAHSLPALIPICTLGENHRERIAQHLLSLDADDRYLRFGYCAQDAQIRSYVASLNFERDEVFGIYNRKLVIIGLAHLAYANDAQHNHCAEFGVSVLPGVRGRGYGGRMFARAARHAGNEGVRLLFIHTLSQNSAMLKIAMRNGALIEQHGSESEAYLRLPMATFDSRVTEIVEEQIAQTDYCLKSQAQSFYRRLVILQSVRDGTIKTDKRASS